MVLSIIDTHSTFISNFLIYLRVCMYAEQVYCDFFTIILSRLISLCTVNTRIAMV